MARILILAFADLSRDPRVKRHIAALSLEHDVTVAALGAHAGTSPRFVQLDRSMAKRSAIDRSMALAHLLSGNSEAKYWTHPLVRSSLVALATATPDLVVANDIETLPLALAVAKGSPVLFDAHEYKPREFEDRWKFRLFARYFRQLWKK